MLVHRKASFREKNKRNTRETLSLGPVNSLTRYLSRNLTSLQVESFWICPDTRLPNEICNAGLALFDRFGCSMLDGCSWPFVVCFRDREDWVYMSNSAGLTGMLLAGLPAIQPAPEPVSHLPQLLQDMSQFEQDGAVAKVGLVRRTLRRLKIGTKKSTNDPSRESPSISSRKKKSVRRILLRLRIMKPEKTARIVSQKSGRIRRRRGRIRRFILRLRKSRFLKRNVSWPGGDSSYIDKRLKRTKRLKRKKSFRKLFFPLRNLRVSFNLHRRS